MDLKNSVYTESDFKKAVSLCRTKIDRLRNNCPDEPSLAKRVSDVNQELINISRKTKNDKKSLAAGKEKLVQINAEVVLLEKAIPVA